jgi:hypothetical protein
MRTVGSYYENQTENRCEIQVTQWEPPNTGLHPVSKQNLNLLLNLFIYFQNWKLEV